MPIPIPRMPAFAMPASASPSDLLNALATNDRDMFKAFIKEPMSALGLNIPDPPVHPARVLSEALGGLGLPLPGLGKKAGNNNSKEQTKFVAGTKVTEI